MNEFTKETLKSLLRESFKRLYKETTIMFRENFNIVDQFSKAEQFKAEKKYSELSHSHEGQLEIIENAKKGEKEALTYLVCYSASALGGVFMKTIFKFYRNKNEAFENFISLLWETLKGEDSNNKTLFDKFSVDWMTDSEGKSFLDAFSWYLAKNVQTKISVFLNKEKRSGIVGNLSKSDKERISISNIDNEDPNHFVSGEDEIYNEVFETTGSYLNAWKEFCKDSKWTEQRKTILAESLKLSGNFSKTSLTQGLKISSVEFDAEMKEISIMMSEHDIDASKMSALLKDYGGENLAAFLGARKAEKVIEVKQKGKVLDIKPEVNASELDKLKATMKGQRGFLRKWIFEFLSNYTGSATWPDFQKSPYYDPEINRATFDANKHVWKSKGLIKDKEGVQLQVKENKAKKSIEGGWGQKTNLILNYYNKQLKGKKGKGTYDDFIVKNPGAEKLITKALFSATVLRLRNKGQLTHD